MLYDYFGNGINLGGWLSQYECLAKAPKSDEEKSLHFKTYITEKNLEQISSWGIDHVRLPVDHRVLEDCNNPFTIKEEAFFYMDLCAEWCEKYGLNLIIDLHHAQGNIWGMMDKPMPLLIDKDCRDQFISLWSNIATHFKGRKKPIIMFELLNEVSDGSGFLWNKFYKETVSCIRKIDMDRYILIGSNEQNSAFRLKELELIDDKNIFYNFHYYDPQVFTHQKAHFSKEMKEFNQTISYPGDISAFIPYLLEHRQYIRKYKHVATEISNDRNLMLLLLKDAIDFVQYSGCELYCGEFGVINTAPIEERIKWIRDCKDIFNHYHIGHALWNYKELDFGLVNMDNRILSERFIKRIYR